MDPVVKYILTNTLKEQRNQWEQNVVQPSRRTLTLWCVLATVCQIINSPPQQCEYSLFTVCQRYINITDHVYSPTVVRTHFDYLCDHSVIHYPYTVTKQSEQNLFKLSTRMSHCDADTMWFSLWSQYTVKTLWTQSAHTDSHLEMYWILLCCHTVMRTH